MELSNFIEYGMSGLILGVLVWVIKISQKERKEISKAHHEQVDKIVSVVSGTKEVIAGFKETIRGCVYHNKK